MLEGNKGKTLGPEGFQHRLGNPPGAAFPEPSPLKHGEQGKSARGDFVLLLHLRAAAGSVSSELLPQLSLSGIKVLGSVWELTLIEQGIYIPLPMLFQRCLHRHSFHPERKWLTLIKKLISEKPNEPKLSSHPATHPAHVQDGKQSQHMLP